MCDLNTDSVLFPVKRLKGAYLKFESVNQYYRPASHTLQAFPQININTPSGWCPFDKAPEKGQSAPVPTLERVHDYERAEREEREKDGQGEEEEALEGLRELEGEDTGPESRTQPSKQAPSKDDKSQSKRGSKKRCVL